MEEAVKRVLTSGRKAAHLTLTWQDIDVLKSINCVLSQLPSLTDVLSGENYVTISALLPLMDDDDETELTRTIKATIKNNLSSQYIDEEIVQLFEVSSVLDPRFKVKYITEARQAEVKSIILTQGIIPESTHQQQEPVFSSAATPQGLQPALKEGKTLGSFIKGNEQNQSEEQALSKTPEEKITTILEKYLSIPMLDAEEEPLPWWKENEKTFPMLARMARKYLCVCGTSSASEHLFSSSGQLVTHLRSHLNLDKVDMLVFLSKNL